MRIVLYKKKLGVETKSKILDVVSFLACRVVVVWEE